MIPKAVGFRIIVEADEVEELSKGGIVVVTDIKAERNASTCGTILDIGEDAFVAFRPKTPYWGLKVGDKIHFAKYAGKWIKDKDTDKEYLAINDEDVCAKG